MKIYLVSTLLLGVLIISSCKKDAEPVVEIKDADGNVYHEIKIGTQTWLLENLRTTKFRNGDAIPNVTDFTQWKNSSTAAYCNFNNDASVTAKEGRLYNWFAVTDSRGICPPGYHIPTREEWQTLRDYLGGESVAGGKMKSTGEEYWTGNTGATNESGFTGIGAGVRNTALYADQDFQHRKTLGLMWSSTGIEPPGNVNAAWYFHLQYNMAQGSLSFLEKTCGISVRCIKD
ncbi:MAG: fibrobacter succinogenes major paralogous domain-containing protein [Chitinophagaceae bacterium]|nr:fibrobacter succinogenes major paralogous domain-containing protein [Chitinophagaceae bacterium]